MTYSVLMSVYKSDSPEYLKTALNSIYGEQTKKPDEIVVVQDGPVPEEIIQVLKGFEDSISNKTTDNMKNSSSSKDGSQNSEPCRFVPVPLPKNLGLGGALAEGAKHCTCDYIFRMDSDDVSDPCRFEKMDAYLQKHPEVDVLGTDIGEFEENPEEVLRTRSCPCEFDDIVKMGKKRNPMNHVTAAIRRSALEGVGGYKPLALVEDYYLWVRMIAHGYRLANINETLVYVRIGNGFGKRRSSKQRIKSWKRLQTYMIDHDMISRPTAWRNMLYIRAFVYAPSGLREFAYKKLLRK